MPNVEHVEALDYDHHDQTSVDMPAAPSPIAGAHTVAYGPDQMLAVYAARGKVNSPAPAASPVMPSAATGSSGPIAQPRPTAKRLLSNLTKRSEEQVAPAPAPPAEMRSMVHLNNGTVSVRAVDQMAPLGPTGGLRPPATTRARSNTTTQRGASDGSAYSEDHVGSAQ